MVREKKKIKIKRSSFVITAIITVPVFFLIGLWIGDAVNGIEAVKNLVTTGSALNIYGYLVRYGVGVLLGLLGLAFSAPMYLLLAAISSKVERSLVRYSSKEILMGVIGLILGVLLAVLISMLLNIQTQTQWARVVFNIVLAIVLGYIGMRIGSKMLYDLLPATNLPRPAKLTSTGNLSAFILDSSCLIDGRVLDVVRTGFLTGLFVIPSEVLNELSRIADNTDELKRNRGRRGLDIVAALQKEKNITVNVTQSQDSAKDVDDAVILLAGETKGRVVTGDSNLAKYAAAQKIEVLNMNDLSNALRPIALPGERMTLKIVKRGKETGQGVAFAPDGTMIVVENGAGRVGDTVEVTVTTSLQTSGGRMIFTRIGADEEPTEESEKKRETRRF